MKILHLVIFWFLIGLLSCTKPSLFSEKASSNFFLKNDCATMPILVEGNTMSKVFCIVLHGGPGDSGIQSFNSSNAFLKVENPFAMVYFDQRAAGISQGNCNGDDLRIADFVKDIDKLILLLESIYGSDIKIFILGHSWGGTLGLEYVINGEQRAKVKGYILCNGSHNIPMLSNEEKKVIAYYSEQQIGYGNNVAEWQAIQDKVKDLDPTLFDDRLTILMESYRTKALFEDVDSILIPDIKADGITSLLANSLLTSQNVLVNNNRTFYEELMAYDNSPFLEQVETPVGLFWGKFDLVHPSIMAETIHDLLVNSESELFYFKQSFHAPMIIENELFQTMMIEFIDKYL